MSSPAHRISLLLPLIVGAFVLSDCHCGKPPPVHPVGNCSNGAPRCSPGGDDCADHQACTEVDGDQCCAVAPRTCTDGSDCCPGQICKRDGHCFDQRVECPNGDSDCGDPGSDRICQTYTDGAGQQDQVCGYAACDATHACADGLACFRGFCVATPPCNGHCDDGSICIPQTNACWGYGKRCMVSCGPGFLAMEQDPSNIWDSCNNRDVNCECDELPPLTSNDLGRYASSTATPDGHVAVSMYDGQYGDLVVRTYDATGNVVSTEYVDGVPATGTVKAGPSGPRHGISDPGDDVGQYTSIAADADGRLFVSYYDVTHGDLKLAIRGADGTWSTQTVDATGDVGLYTSVALDASGVPSVAYFQRAGDIGGTACPGADASKPNLITGVKLARASSANPTGPSSWTSQFVECAARPPASCEGCTSGQICVQNGSGAGVCATTGSGCGTCTGGQVCANTGGASACAATYTAKALVSVPPGVGLYPSLAFQGQSVVVAYYDNLHHRLRAAAGSGSLTPVTVDDGCAGGGTCHDVGMFTNVAVESGGQHRIAIAYEDATARSLKLYLGAQLGAASPTAPDAVIDDGLAPPELDGPSYVGANVSLLFAQDGRLWAAYQNSTANDLELALHASTGWTVEQTTWHTGAVGWFSHIAQLPTSSNLFISHTQLHTRLQQGHPVKDITPHLEIYTPQP